MLVELKNGETLNGHLVTCDTWMNLTLKEVVQTSPVRFCPSSARGFWGLGLGLGGDIGWDIEMRKEMLILGTMAGRKATSSFDYQRFMSRGTTYVRSFLAGSEG